MYAVNIITLHAHEGEEILLQFEQFSPECRAFSYDDFFDDSIRSKTRANVFVFDEKILKNKLHRINIEEFLKKSPSQINFCIIKDKTSIAPEADFLSLFHDFFVWPCSSQEIQTRLYRFLQPESKKIITEGQLLSEFSHLHLTGESPIFIKTISLIKKMAGCHASVLIQGETGTGKENAARAIHYLSSRRDHAFIPINCAAIPDDLIESELFGHERGAFTDAKTTQHGLVQLAQNGTLFLDEVDSLTPKAQGTLLRFLQTQEYRPLGSKITLHADVRILAATNADLKQLVQRKLFREDLYFRLNVLNLYMPPLRQRTSDIPLITNALIEKFSQQHKISTKKIHPAYTDYLMRQEWPGNIRELENLLLRSFLLSPGNILSIESNPNESEEQPEAFVMELSDLPSRSTLRFQDAKAQAVTKFEKSYLEDIMQLVNGNVSAAARIAGKERRALGKLLQKYKIHKSNFKSA